MIFRYELIQFIHYPKPTFVFVLKSWRIILQLVFFKMLNGLKLTF